MGEKVASGKFNEFEKNTSSTVREILAFKNVLTSFEKDLKHHRVQWCSDNINATRIITNGSTKEHLQNLAMDIFNFCFKNTIQIEAQWVPRELNTRADFLSKWNDTDDWGIDFETYDYLTKNYGQFSCDRFANSTNTKCQKFNSLHYCPGSAGVNAFSFDWKNEFNWLCPPIHLIAKTIKHLEHCKAVGVLLLPEWKSAYFWPLISGKDQRFKAFVKHYLLLDPYYLNGDGTQKSIFDGFAKFYSLALYIDFSQ